MKLTALLITVLATMTFAITDTSATYNAWKSYYLDAERLMADGRFPEALSFAKLSVTESRNRHGEETINTVKSLALQSELTKASGNYKRAVKLQSDAYDLIKRIKGAHDPNTITALCRLAQLATLAGNSKTGEAYYRDALATCQDANRQGCITAAGPMMGLAQVLVSEGRYAEAEELYLLAIERFCCFSKYRPALKLKMAGAFESLGAMYGTSGDYSKAARCYSKSEKIYRSQRVVPLEQLGKILLSLGNTYSKLGKPERSLKCYKEALRIFEYEGNTSPKPMGLVCKGLGDIFRGKGNLELAANYYKKAVTHFQTLDFVGRPLFAKTIKSLSEVYREMGKESEARMMQSKFLAMD
jgi:tetratricopeptide (TPR) repeat protein